MNQKNYDYRNVLRSLGAVILAIALPVLPSLSQSTSTVLLEVSSFKNTRGTLNCRLFTKASDFPDGEGILTVRTPIAGANTTCTFPNVEPGTYAVAVVHDENSNGKLDKNFVGVPSEGYGVSNNKTYALSAPKWDESVFTIAPSESKTLQVKLRY
jgi:uncharacterized protein (DUF2141 family)